LFENESRSSLVGTDGTQKYVEEKKESGKEKDAPTQLLHHESLRQRHAKIGGGKPSKIDYDREEKRRTLRPHTDRRMRHNPCKRIYTFGWAGGTPVIIGKKYSSSIRVERSNFSP